MKRIVALVCLHVLLGVAAAAPAWADPPDTGGVQTLRTYDPDAFELPEGIAIDKRGRTYITMPFRGELRRLDPDGSERVVAHLPVGEGFGPLGLALDAPGNIYVAVTTFDPATHGVWKVTPDGTSVRLPGSEAIAFPNGLTFGKGGTLYVSDTIGGAVWRIPPNGSTELWVQHPMLAGDGSAGMEFPIGANGIAYRQRTVYVAVTEQASVVAIDVAPDGSAGTPSLLVQDHALDGADGMALDVHGDIYVALILQSAIVHIEHATGAITALATGDDGLDFTSSVAFGTGRGERTTLFAVNFSIGPFFGGVRTHGPALLALDVGVPGLPQP